MTNCRRNKTGTRTRRATPAGWPRGSRSRPASAT